MTSTIKHAPISAMESGSTPILPTPDPGFRYRIFSYVLVAESAVNITWRGGSQDLTGIMPVTGNGVGASYSSVGHLVTPEATALELHQSADVRVGGHLTYWVERA